MKSPSKDVFWFHENAGLILSDLKHCRDGEPPRSYWDTAEVHGAALGYSDLYIQGQFNKRSFDSAEYLVRCLMASGWYGKINMLEPHKYEFITRLGRFLDAQEREPSLGRLSPTNADDFVRAAIGKDISTTAKLKDIDKIIKEQSARADSLFKAIQSLGSFEQRVSIWRNMDILTLTSESHFDYSQVLGSDAFEHLRQYLDSTRPETPINNFTDAAALCLLQTELGTAVSRGLSIPILFDSGAKMQRAAAKLMLQGFLTYQSADGKDVPVLRNASYYLLRASIWIPDRFSGTTTKADRISELKEMWELTDGYVRLASHLNIHGPESFMEIEPRLAEKIAELRRLWFLDRVWLPFAVDSRTVEFASPFLDRERGVLESAKALAGSEAYRTRILRDLESLRGRFVAGATRYTHLTKTWLRIRGSIEKFVAQFEYLVELQPKSLANIFGLVRFGLPEEIEKEAEDHLWWFIGPGEIRKEVIGEVILHCLDFIRVDGARKAPPDWIFVVLWVLEDDATISELMQQRRKESSEVPVWLEIVYGASLLRSKTSETRVEKIIGDLMGRLDEDVEPEIRAQIMIGLAYLYFHIWENRNRKYLWSFRAFLMEVTDGEDIEIDTRIQQALSWALNARNAASIGSSRYVYALNLYVYYCTEGANEREFDRVDGYAAELLGFVEDRALWQYRFSDTLARFYHRCAMERTGVPRKDMLMQALKFIDEAVREGKGDRKVATYQQQLKLIIALQYGGDS